MRILHIVPEFEQGGVERYVIELSREQVSHGHQVSLATAGGKLEAELPREVEVIHLPVLHGAVLCVPSCAEAQAVGYCPRPFPGSRLDYLVDLGAD